VINLSDLDKSRRSTIAKVKRPREILVSLPNKRIKEFGIQQIISTLLAERLPLGLKRIFK
tara:strand:+ start:214009 stop:214188 length:180 start_codon:yes stop_codon:yes gene_type:complete